MGKIVTKFGKFRYNCPHMEMCALGDTFQAKVDNMLIDIKSLKTYSNDILVLRKDILSKHLNQMRIIFGRLCAADLKVNAPKCSFGFKKIPYLG